jgi:hypothetical protein
MEVAIAPDWWPPHRPKPEPVDDEAALDWESLRLAAVCRVFIEAHSFGIAD